MTQTSRQDSLKLCSYCPNYGGYSHKWSRVWRGLSRLSWAGYLPVCHPTAVTAVVTSLSYSSPAAQISALGLKACCLCKGNKPLQTLESVLGTQRRKWWLLPCRCYPCRLLTCSRRVVLPPLCPLFPGYLLQFSTVLGSHAAPFLPRSCSAHTCCLAGLAAHMGSGERAWDTFVVVERGYSSQHRGAGGGKGHCSTLSTLCPIRACYYVVTCTPKPHLSKSSSGVFTGLITTPVPPREAAGKKGLLCICSHTRIWGHPVKLMGAGLRQWKKEIVPHVGHLELPAVGCSVCWVLSWLQTRLNGNREEKPLGSLSRESTGDCGRPHMALPFCSLGICLQLLGTQDTGAGHISFSGNKAVLEMLKGKETGMGAPFSHYSIEAGQ